MKYRNFIDKLSKRAKYLFDEIDSVHNFESGLEFESTLAGIFQDLLPDKYGVCRGYVTPEEGKPAGDDIIIYDRSSFPLIRPRKSGAFLDKEYVPAEATYAYIEAKNTIELEDTSRGTYLGKALKQTEAVKRVPKRSRPVEEIHPHLNLGAGLRVDLPVGWPRALNPIFSCVFSRGVRINGRIEENPRIILNTLINNGLPGDACDFIVLGNDIIIIPTVETEKGPKTFASPFFIDGHSQSTVLYQPDSSYGVALLSIVWAISRIELAAINYASVLEEAVMEGSRATKDLLNK